MRETKGINIFGAPSPAFQDSGQAEGRRGVAFAARPGPSRLELSAWALLIGLTLETCAATRVVTNSFAAALARAQPNDTLIVVGPRVFQERLTIDKPVRLIGSNAPIIDGCGSNHTVQIIATNVEFRGFTVRNSGRDLNTLDSAIMISGNRALVTDCRTENDGFGIYLRGATECRIERNIITGDPGWTPSLRGNGIHLWKTKTNVVAQNAIRDKRDGIYFAYAHANTIAGNDIRHTRFAIHYMYSHFNHLLTNSFTANSVGATLMFSQWAVIEGNVALANRRHGFVLKQLDNSTIRRNVIIGQNRGLFVQQATACRFEENVISTNDIGVYLSNGSEQNVFVGNTFMANVDHVWQPPYEAELGRGGPNRFYDGRRGNFWSDYTGSDRNGDGVGDAPYFETDVYGYILDRYPEARVFALSPALAALRKGEELMPIMDTPGVADMFPLVRPAFGTALEAKPGKRRGALLSSGGGRSR